MKKIVLIILLIIFSFGVFALESTTGNILVNAYYDAPETKISFKVWSGVSTLDINRIYHSGIITVDNPISSEITIFNWELGSTADVTVRLTFTITPLQAFFNGTYYIPKHTVAMYDGLIRQEHAFSTKSTGSSSYPNYRQSSSGAGAFIIKSATFSYDENLLSDQIKTGHCTLKVLDYEEDSAGNFDYVSYVTVEFSVL